MLINLKDYERIFRIINAIVENEGADASVCCTFFGIYGAHILRRHFKIDANPKAGMAGYHVGGDNRVLFFAKKEQDGFVSDPTTFHCWVEAEGWAIDFMAPTFPKICNGIWEKEKILPKMFQKPLSAMSDSPFSLSKSGDFYLQSSPEIIKSRFEYLSRSLAYSDLAEACSKWFVKSPKKIPDSIGIGDGKGDPKRVRLSETRLVGVW